MDKQHALTEQARDDVYAHHTDRKGFGGWLERLIRRFRMLSFGIALVFLYFLVLVAMGISATPGVYLFMFA